jgi:hypothetical protein
MALWVFIVPVFLLGFSSTLRPEVSRIITAPFSATVLFDSGPSTTWIKIKNPKSPAATRAI